MGAARHIGRVGGLAIALGVGGAILTGQGIASAETDGQESKPTSESAPKDAPAGEPQPSKTDDDAPVAGEAQGGGGGQPTKHARLTQPMKVGASGGARIRVRHERAVDTPHEAVEKKDAGKDEAPKDEASKDEGPKDEASKDEAPKDEAPKEEAPKDDVTPVVAPVTLLKVQEDLPKPAAPGPNAPIQDSANALMAAVARRELVTTSAAPEEAPSWSAPKWSVTDGVITADVGDQPPSFYEVVSGPEKGGKVTFDPMGNGDFTFLPDASQLTESGTDSFKVLVVEKSALVQFLETVPGLKDFVRPVVLALHRIPIVGTILSPIIGTARTYDVTVPVSDFVDGTPIAFTTMVESFDGVMISVNYFPRLDLEAGQQAPTILNGPSLATAGYTDPTQETTVFGLVPGLAMLRENYNVVTWDPRGEYASGGRLHLDSEDFEAKDVSKIIDWVEGQDTTLDEEGTDDPLIGMVGGSYGGGIQLTSAGIDKRIDAISPGIAWNDLTHTLYPDHAFKTSWASLLLLSLVASGSRLDPEIYYGIATGVLFGFLTKGQQEFLSGNSPDTVADEITIPTLFLQGTVDTLFPLRQAMANAEAINPEDPVEGDVPVPMKMVWYCGGHGQCLDPVDLDQQTVYTTNAILDWMDTYVMNKGSVPSTGELEDPEKFTWVDQEGNWWASSELPTESDFYGDVYPVPGTTSGLLPIVPVFGGSGPDWAAKFPVSLVNGAKVEHGALNLYVPNPSPEETTYYVGTPKLTMTYSGVGTSRNVYAQLVDNNTGRVVGNIVSPIPVVLDGKENTVEVDMEAIAYTMSPNEPGVDPDSLTLQIFDSATAFENFTSFGVINVKSVELTLPTANADQVEGLDMASV